MIFSRRLRRLGGTSLIASFRRERLVPTPDCCVPLGRTGTYIGQIRKAGMKTNEAKKQVSNKKDLCQSFVQGALVRFLRIVYLSHDTEDK